MDRKELQQYLLPGLIFWFGLQIIRVFFPSVMWYLSQELGEYELAVYALLTFGLIFLAPVLARWLSQAAALGGLMVGILLVRLALQFISSALMGLVLSTLGLVLFVNFLPLWLQSDANRGGRAGVSTAAVAFPLAFLVDTATRSLLWSYDLVWRKSLWAVGLVVILAVFTAWLLWLEMRGWKRTGGFAEPPSRQVLPLLGIGAWLYLGYGTYMNPQALMGLTGAEDRIAHLIVNAVAAAGSVLAVWSATATGRPSTRWAAAPALAAVFAGVMIYLRVLPLELWFIVAALSLWSVLGRILQTAAFGDTLRPGVWQSSLALFFSFLLMLIFVFLNEFDFHWINPLAVALLAGMGMLSAFREMPRPALQTVPERQRINKWAGYIAQGAVALVVLWVLWNQPLPAPERVISGPNLRVMTYNIHQGINADLYMDMEEIIRVIEDQNADVIGLNEVNRGRANNGYTDTLALLSRRLGMPYVYGANFVDGQYGNAILSRYSIESWSNLHYAVNTTEVRGLLNAVLRTVDGQAVNFYSTHLDHTGGPRNARGAQIEEALSRLGAERVIFTGDLNAPPSAAEMQPLYQSQLVDALEAAGWGGSFTFWSDRFERIDYIFVSSDLGVEGAEVPETRASDHLPVIVDLRLP